MNQRPYERILKMNKQKLIDCIYWKECMRIYFILLIRLFWKVIIIMTSLTHGPGFGTAAKIKNLQANSKTYQSTISKRSVYMQQSPRCITPSHEVADPEKRVLVFSSKKTQDIRIELNGSEWKEDRPTSTQKQEHAKPANGESEERILKEIGSKVKGFIMRNQEMHVHSHYQQILALKRQNDELQAMINQYRGSAAIDFGEHQEEDREDGQRKSKEQTGKQEQTGKYPSTRKVEMRRQSNQEIEEVGVAGLKKYFMTYINTVIDQNDDRIRAQQRKIDFLEKRVSQLTKLQEKVDHLKFERTVKLQKSTRKSKNFSVAPIKNIGDRFKHQPQLMEGEERQEPKMFKKPYKQYAVDESAENSFLFEKIKTLQDQLQKLKEKYDFEMEAHINDITDREELLASIEKLSTENKFFQQQNFQLTQRIKYAHEKQGDLEIYFLNQKHRTSGRIEPNIGHSFKKAIIDIRNQLKACGVNHIKDLEKTITAILIDRDYLKKELERLQQLITQGSKFSITHREIFLLKQKNRQLEQACRQYRSKLSEYQKNGMKNQDVSEQIDERALTAKRNDELTEQQCLKWIRTAHFCMLSSITRLQQLEKHIGCPQPQV